MELEEILDRLTTEQSHPPTKVELLVHVVTDLLTKITQLERRVSELESHIYG